MYIIVIDICFSTSCILPQSLSIYRTLQLLFWCNRKWYYDIGSITSSSVPCSPKACLQPLTNSFIIKQSSWFYDSFGAIYYMYDMPGVLSCVRWSCLGCVFSHFEFYRVRINTWQSQAEHFDFFDPNLCHLVECKSSLKNLLHPFDIAYLMSRVSWLACLGQWDDLLKVGK